MDLELDRQAAKRQIGCSVHEANHHGFLLRLMVGSRALPHTAKSFTAAADRLHPFIRRRVPVAYDGFGDKFPVGHVIRSNNLWAMAALATCKVRELCPQVVQELLIAYGQHHYFEVDCTDLRIASGGSMTPLQQAIVYSSVPAALAFIELGALPEAPEVPVEVDQVVGSLRRNTHGVAPELEAFSAFLNEHHRRGTPAYESIMGAIRTRSMRQEIAHIQASAPEPGVATVTEIQAPSKRRRIV